jgi:hypothetical protein
VRLFGASGVYTTQSPAPSAPPTHAS